MTRFVISQKNVHTPPFSISGNRIQISGSTQLYLIVRRNIKFKEIEVVGTNIKMSTYLWCVCDFTISHVIMLYFSSIFS